MSAKKTLKWLAAILLTPVALILLLAAMVYVPPVQNWLVKKVAAIASDKTGMTVSVGHVDLDFPLDLGLDDVLVVSQGDTVADLRRAVVDVRLLPLFRQQVVVDELQLIDGKINTLNFISDLQISGRVGRLALSSPGIDLRQGYAPLHDFRLEDADVTVALSDTAAVDTTESAPLLWRISLDEGSILRSRVSVSLPGDTIRAAAFLQQARVSSADIDLASSRYAVGSAEVSGSSLSYDVTTMPAATSGIDYNHLAANDVTLAVDSIVYHDPITRFHLRNASLRERSGLSITSASGDVTIDATGIRLPAFSLQTPYSKLYTEADVDFSVADDSLPGQMNVRLDAQLGKHDLMLFAPDLPTNVSRHWPEWPLDVKGTIEGNMQKAVVRQLSVDLPTVMRTEASGTLSNISQIGDLLAQLDLKVQTYDPTAIARLAGLPADYRLPRGLKLAGKVGADGSRYSADVTMTDGAGRAHVKGFFDQQSEAYQADVSISRLNLHRFMPRQQLYTLTADMQLSGRGTDFTRRGARLDADATIRHLQYGQLALDNMQATARLADGHATAFVTGNNQLFDGTVSADALLDTKRLSATVGSDLSRIDLYALGVTDRPLTIGTCGHIDIESDLDQSHHIQGHLSDLYLRDSVKIYRPQDIDLRLLTDRDTTMAHLESGDMRLSVNAAGGYEPLFAQLTALADTISQQFSNRIIDQPRLKAMLPVMHLYANSGRNNSIAEFLRTSADIDFKDFFADISFSPASGVNGDAHLYALNADSIRIDTVRLHLKDTAHGLTFQGQVTNNRRNPQFVFNALIDGHLYEKGARMGLRYYDDRGQLGLRLGASAAMQPGGISFHLMPERPTIGYKEFNLNPDNFLFIDDDLRLQAKVDLIADDGTGIKIYTPLSTLQEALGQAANDDDPDADLQDLTISLYRFDLDQLTSVLPYMPRVAGLLNGDYHLIMNKDRQISVASDMQVKGMAYEGNPMGDLSTEFVYLQREDNTHAVEGILRRNNVEVGAVRGEYHNVGEGSLDVNLKLTHMPLDMANGFIPDQIIGFEGFTEGEVSIKGSLRRPQAEGELFLDSAFLISKPYGVRLRFDDDPVRIADSKLLLENFTMYANRAVDGQYVGDNNNPLNIMGEVDFHDTERITTRMRMRATNFQLINAKRSKESLAFGKAFVNFFAFMNGPIDRLTMRGRLDILGSTDLTYMLLDSPLSTDNRLDELVKFTDFTDTTQMVVQRPVPEGLNMDLTVSIDQGAHVLCNLNTDETNYVDLLGGGDLRMKYNSDGLRLNGRYTLSSGEMKYSLPVIPLKTFNIQDGSYVEFTGDPMNPRLNITATERTKATVGQDGEQSRSVAFDCGVVITKTLDDMGLEFIISAPEDMTVSSELQAMSKEQRGKLAVTMLTTGMYLADGNTSGFSMNSALSSFLQSEINQITGNALKTLDLSFGLDNTTDASGAMHTDYSFKFAKRFWNNRLKVQIGGKVSTGTEAQGQNQSFFDNVTMEYRLSPTSNQYVKLFYNQNVYDWLDGYTGEYGAGYVWKRKLDSLWDIFKKTPKQNTMRGAMPSARQASGRATADSLTTKKIAPTDTTRTEKK